MKIREISQLKKKIPLEHLTSRKLKMGSVVMLDVLKIKKRLWSLDLYHKILKLNLIRHID